MGGGGLEGGWVTQSIECLPVAGSQPLEMTQGRGAMHITPAHRSAPCIGGQPRYNVKPGDGAAKVQWG
jgi:hypothetical protein